jgi:hypothetical protein
MSRRALRWITTTGGPLLVLARANLRAWSGINPSNDPLNDARFRWNKEPGAPASDYDRACDVKGPIAVLEIGSAHGIVLGDAPDATLWWPLSETSGYFVRQLYANEGATVRDALAAVPDALFHRERQAFTVTHKSLILFDSSVPGREFRAMMGAGFEYQTVQLAPGTYNIETARYEPDSETALVLHRLRPAATPQRRRKKRAAK